MANSFTIEFDLLVGYYLQWHNHQIAMAHQLARSSLPSSSFVPDSVDLADIQFKFS